MILCPDYQLYCDCVEAIALAALQGRTLAECLGEETAIAVNNLVSAREFALKADCPAKIWWNCPPRHPAIARALKIDPSQEGAFYALSPFRLWHDGNRHVILAAYPCPRLLGPIDMDWLAIETVFAWNPVTDEAEVLADHTPGLFGAPMHEGGTIYRSPLDFFQNWAIERAKWFVSWAITKGRDWQHVSDTDSCPGRLAIGPIQKIQWSRLPKDFEVRGIDPTELNRAIIRQANLPRAYSTNKKAAA